VIVLWLPLDRHVEVKVNQRYAYPRTFSTGRLLAVAAPPKGEIEIEIEASGTGPLPVEVADRTFGVPPGTRAEAAVKARPPAAVAFQDGDITVVSRKLSL
jgi:hypothetical protein